MNAQVNDLTVIPSSPSELLFSNQAFGRMQELAKMMCGGKTTIPVHLQGNPADCMAIIMQAAQWRMNPFAVAQKTHLVNGTLGYEAQLVNAVITSLAPIEGRLDYEFFGDWDRVIGRFEIKTSDKGKKYANPAWSIADEKGLGMVVRGTLKGESKPRELVLLMSQCWPRQSTNWAYDPQQQMVYSGVKKWARRYVPDVILGVYSPDELGAGDEIDITSRASVERESDVPPSDNFTPKAKSKSKPETKADDKIEGAAHATEQKPEGVAVPVQDASGEDDGPKITGGQLTMIKNMLSKNGLSDTVILSKMGLNDLADIPLARINEAMKLARG